MPLVVPWCIAMIINVSSCLVKVYRCDIYIYILMSIFVVSWSIDMIFIDVSSCRVMLYTSIDVS